MKLQLNYKGGDCNRIKELVVKAYNDISAYFKDKLENLIVCVHKNRKEFDKKLNRKTKLWLVANVANGEINILHSNSFAKESTHKANEFFPILKHEIAHLFIDRMTNGKSVPNWLDEGLASYVSEKYKDIKHSIYIEEDFCEKLGTPKGWDEHSDYYAYDTASLFVAFLAEKYTLDKTMELFSKLDRNYYYPEFETAFKNIFGKTLKDLEKDFVHKINK
ncbi:MAG: basic secretory protein-like protein [Patescibacteria group bacterium]